jgi:hypothetical protein
MINWFTNYYNEYQIKISYKWISQTHLTNTTLLIL